jgi:hypothetical protein
MSPSVSNTTASTSAIRSRKPTVRVPAGSGHAVGCTGAAGWTGLHRPCLC